MLINDRGFKIFVSSRSSVRIIAPFWGGIICGVDIPLNAANCGKPSHTVSHEVELVFINTCKDHVNSCDASLRQYIFLQIGVYSMQKYPLQA